MKNGGLNYAKGIYYKEKPIDTRNWLESLKPMYEEIYQVSANEYYHDFLKCMLDVLFDLYMKIQLDGSGSHHQLKNILYVSFNKSIARNYELPLERVIAELCGLIQSNIVIYNNNKRYNIHG